MMITTQNATCFKWRNGQNNGIQDTRCRPVAKSNFLSLITLTIYKVFLCSVLFGTLHITALAADKSETETIVTILNLLFGEDEKGFASNLALGPDTIYSGKSSEIIAAITLIDATNDEEIELWQSSKSGTLLQKVAILKDTGDIDTGDFLKGDGIFHGKFTLTPPEPGIDYYRAFYKGKFSETVSLALVPELSDVSLNEASNQADHAKSVFDQILSGGGGPQDGQTAVQTMLSNEPGVAKYGKSDDNYGSWWVTNEGIIVIHDPLSDETVFSEGQVNTKEGPQDSFALPERYVPQYSGVPLLPRNKNFSVHPQLQINSKTALQKADDNIKRIGSKDVLILDFWDFLNIPGFDTPDAHIEQVLTDYGMNVKSVVPASLNDLKNLSKYGVVSIVSHGTSVSQEFNSILWGLFEWWSYEDWNELPANGFPVIATPIDETDDMKKDIAAGRLAVRGKGKIAVLPSFISHYNNGLPDSIILMTICQGAYNNKLANAFTAKGAAAFYGYSDIVDVSFAVKHGKAIFDHLVLDKTTGTYPGIGDDDGGSTPAELTLIGDADIRLIDPSILENGDFESGSLNSWNPSGDVRVIQKLQSLDAPQGTYMAVLTTGVGADNVGSTSILVQKIRPSSSKHILKFRYNFVSEEPLEFVGSVFNDKFDLIIGTNTTTVESINGSNWIELGGNFFDGGDSTTYHTGWKEMTVDLSSNINTLISLQFKVSDVGDSAYDSAVLIDNIRLD